MGHVSLKMEKRVVKSNFVVDTEAYDKGEWLLFEIEKVFYQHFVNIMKK